MKNRYCLYRLLFIVFVLCFPAIVHAYSLRQFSNKDGLSNSAILSLYQDYQGKIWIGSCDGLNVFDGINIDVYSAINSSTALSGNLINSITETDKDILWIQTNYGLDRLDTKTRTRLSFPEFKEKNHIAKNEKNDLFIIKDNGHLYYYRHEKQEFPELDIPPIAFDHVLSITVDKNNRLWIFTSDNDTRCYQIDKTEDGVGLLPCEPFAHPERLLWAFAEDQSLYFIDETYSLYEYDLDARKQYYITDLKKEIKARGEVSSIIKKQDDYYIGFKSSGLIVLKHLPAQRVRYQIQPTKIQSGIFCLMKDKFQDIIWIGTDGQGVYMYFNDAFTITDTLLDTPLYQVNNPIRALYFDESRTLWIGTKGGGILRIKDYDPDTANEYPDFDRLTANNSSLTDNAVYCFAPGSGDRLWIGTEDGINYYSYRNRQMKELSITADGKKVRYVHSVNELNDSTLWISTVGEGIVKVVLSVSGSSPVVKSAKRFMLDKGRMASNYFFTSFQENDSTLWFGNRGYGAYRLDLRTEELLPYRFDNIVSSQMVNDIFAIHKNEKGYWLGTSSGLLYFHRNDLFDYGGVSLFLNNTVHGILEDNRKNIWLSTNQGLVKFDPETGTGQSYDRKNGLKVNEFSDGAFYKDKRSETLFFGGTNGFVTIKPNNYTAEDYMPRLNLKKLSVFGKDYNIYDYLSEKNGQTTLQLDYNRNFFCIDFISIDHINGNNYSYAYRLEEVSEQWIENGASTSAVFSNLSPGRYTLLMKYRNNINGKESLPERLIIRIAPPWYMSGWAYAVYFVLIACLLFAAVRQLVGKYRRRQHLMIDKMNQQKKEEIYESKLRFFTNITHEFCTPLTLIYGPCEKILTYPHSDEYIRKYGQIIQQNTEKLNDLIIELLEFRKLETGHKKLSVSYLSVSDKVGSIAGSFSELAESRRLNYTLNIEPDIRWHTDAGCFNKIIGNLMSNAFKYTPDGGDVDVTLRLKGEQLMFSISNSGKGIAKENLSKIFDRYKILDSFEMNGKDSRNGLGLAICKSMVTLLNGSVTVDSTPGELTTFTVVLPELQPVAHDTAAREEYKSTPLTPLSPNAEPVKLERTVREYDASRQTIMIIDDDPYMLWFVSENFVDKYNVLSFSNANDALEALNMRQPDLIISDVMMPQTDGLTFAQTVKQNKLWNHIPLILLSALRYDEDQVRGIDSGAEAYITKPFNVKYLEKVVHRLIKRKSDLKEYYSSALSSFTIEGSNCIHKEDQDFLDRMMEIIAGNVANPDLSVELLSSDLGYSTRQFYRKLKSATDKSPADIIRDYRLTVVERLLLTKNYTIEEIMDKTGFTNRTTFYKSFSLRFGMPPRQYREQQRDLVRKEATN